MQSLYESNKPLFWSRFLDANPNAVAGAADEVVTRYEFAHRETASSLPALLLPVLRLPATGPSLRVAPLPAAVVLWDDETREVVGVIDISQQEAKSKITVKIPVIELEEGEATAKRAAII